MSERCPTGIPGLDEILGGGLPRARTILLSGTCGTGKTTIAVQFLVEGIRKYGEPGVLVTLEQSADELRSDMLQYGWDLAQYEAEGNLLIIDTSLAKVGVKDFITTLPISPQTSFSLLPDEFDLSKIVGLTIQAARKVDAKRIIVDSLPGLNVLLEDAKDLRRAMINMAYEFKASGLTTLLIDESEENDGLTKSGVAEYVADGVIIVKTNDALDMRTLKVRKMRTVKHTLKPMTIEFGPEGVIVKEQAVHKAVI